MKAKRKSTARINVNYARISKTPEKLQLYICLGSIFYLHNAVLMLWFSLATKPPGKG